ncbi:hypothetical protein AXF42_Ash016571 [Apostasia shenzhenica]|uniref:Uncharacterized protein n=1 Tax=Apostasia shenzhenica TaxID=1088818 RepID=A0A2I0AVH9_9ASPA|nr:hypothetical protein AXF42_Ash016571 [Apostasia shenzhenica]
MGACNSHLAAISCAESHERRTKGSSSSSSSSLKTTRPKINDLNELIEAAPTLATEDPMARCFAMAGGGGGGSLRIREGSWQPKLPRIPEHE